MAVLGFGPVRLEADGEFDGWSVGVYVGGKGYRAFHFPRAWSWEVVLAFWVVNHLSMQRDISLSSISQDRMFLVPLTADECVSG